MDGNFQNHERIRDGNSSNYDYDQQHTEPDLDNKACTI